MKTTDSGREFLFAFFLCSLCNKGIYHNASLHDLIRRFSFCMVDRIPNSERLLKQRYPGR